MTNTAPEGSVILVDLKGLNSISLAQPRERNKIIISTAKGFQGSARKIPRGGLFQWILKLMQINEGIFINIRASGDGKPICGLSGKL